MNRILIPQFSFPVTIAITLLAPARCLNDALCNSHGRLVLWQISSMAKGSPFKYLHRILLFSTDTWVQDLHRILLFSTDTWVQEAMFKLEFRNVIVITSWPLYEHDIPSKKSQSIPHSLNIKSLVLDGLGIKYKVHTRKTRTSILLQYSDHLFVTTSNTAQGQHSIWDSLRFIFDSSQGISKVQIIFSGNTGD